MREGNVHKVEQLKWEPANHKQNNYDKNHFDHL